MNRFLSVSAVALGLLSACLCSSSACAQQATAAPAVTASAEPMQECECRGANCLRRQAAPAQQPAVVEPPKFDMAAAETESSDVPTLALVAACAAAAVVGGVAGVAVQWKATHKS